MLTFQRHLTFSDAHAHIRISPMTETYAAWWPIHDDQRTMSQLTAEALDDLRGMVDAIGYIIPGWIRWETDEWPDAGLVLLAVAPVVRHPRAVLQEELAARSLSRNTPGGTT